jgi:hypothetical protein
LIAFPADTTAFFGFTAGATTRYNFRYIDGLLTTLAGGKSLQEMEARVRIELTHKGFADLSLTTWVPRRLCGEDVGGCGCVFAPTWIAAGPLSGAGDGT